jgi:hypothetical protein
MSIIGKDDETKLATQHHLLKGLRELQEATAWATNREQHYNWDLSAEELLERYRSHRRYNALSNSEPPKNPNCNCEKSEDGYCCNLLCKNYYPN